MNIKFYAEVILFIGLAICAILIGRSLGRNGNISQATLDSADHTTVIDTIDGHDYIVVRANDCIAIIHSASCPCQNK